MMVDKIKLFVTAPFSSENKDFLVKEFSKEYDITFQNDIQKDEAKGGTKDKSKDKAPYDAEVIIGEPDIDEVNKFSNLELVQMTWAGTDKYTRNPGFPSNVKLANATGAFGVIIAEYVIGSILSAYRHLELYHDNQKEHIWQNMGPESSLFNKEVLVLGAGNIGSEVAKRLKAFGCNITGIKKNVEEVPGFDKVCGMEDLNSCLSCADIVVCCLPNTDETIGLLNKERLLRMKKDATLVNVGRGALIVEKDLIEVLEGGHFAHVIMDVCAKEPLAKDSLLWDCKRVHITPHISGIGFGHCSDTEKFILNICAENLKRYYNKDRLINEVNLKKGYAE